MSKFKVGDRVRILHTDYPNQGLDVDDIRTVIEVETNGVKLQSNDFGLLYFYDGEVELVNPNPDYNDGKWHGWNGGECPVHPESVVEVRWENTNGPKEIHKAGDINKGAQWSWDFSKHASSNAIVAFRVVTPYREPREITIDGVIYREVIE
jgi:hypothetical protein